MAMVGVKTSVGGLYFDAVFKADHTSKITITEHPVEVGANINDHAYMNPNELSLEIGISDSARGTGGYGSGGGRSISAYKALRSLQEKRQPITVVTKLKTYKNMMIESIMAGDDYTTTHALKATIFLREVILVKTNSVQVSTREGGGDEQKAGETNSGTQQPQTGSSSETNQSILSQAASKLGIGA